MNPRRLHYQIALYRQSAIHQHTRVDVILSRIHSFHCRRPFLQSFPCKVYKKCAHRQTSKPTLLTESSQVAGYDASNDLYMVRASLSVGDHSSEVQAFLSKEMQYSCPIWSVNEGGVRGDLEGHRTLGDLEAAQVTKINYILRKSRLTAGGRLLEIGSGWGSVAIAVSAFSNRCLGL